MFPAQARPAMPLLPGSLWKLRLAHQKQRDQRVAGKDFLAVLKFRLLIHCCSMYRRAIDYPRKVVYSCQLQYRYRMCNLHLASPPNKNKIPR